MNKFSLLSHRKTNIGKDPRMLIYTKFFIYLFSFFLNIHHVVQAILVLSEFLCFARFAYCN